MCYEALSARTHILDALIKFAGDVVVGDLPPPDDRIVCPLPEGSFLGRTAPPEP